MAQQHMKISTVKDGVVAGDAVNTTPYYYYLDMNQFRKFGAQFEWTAGAGGGTVIVTFEGSMQDDGTADASKTYHDITSTLFLGIASFTDDFQVIEYLEKSACFKVIRIKVVIANKDASTAFILYTKQVA